MVWTPPSIGTRRCAQYGQEPTEGGARIEQEGRTGSAALLPFSSRRCFKASPSSSRRSCGCYRWSVRSSSFEQDFTAIMGQGYTIRKRDRLHHHGCGCRSSSVAFPSSSVCRRVHNGSRSHCRGSEGWY